MITGALQFEYWFVEAGAREGVGVAVEKTREGAKCTNTVEEVIAGMARRVCPIRSGCGEYVINNIR